MNLYEIDQAIMGCVDEETGEIVNVEWLDHLQMERERKIENILCWIKNLKSDAEALKAEKAAIADRQKAAENKAARLTEYISGVLDGQKFQSAKASATWRKSEGVVIEGNVWKLPDEYLRYKEPEPDKTKIKNDIKNGIEVPNCHLEERNNLTIK